MPDGKIPVIAGPTAAGKSALALVLAEELGADIISADSRQIYKELSIGTAKPSADDLRRVQHHFVDALDLDEAISAGIFERLARARIETVQKAGRPVVVVGGSTLYIHALLFGLADIPDVPADLARETNAELERVGSTALHAMLADLDPESAARIDPSNPHRVARALNVVRSTGRSIGSFYSSTKRDARFALFVLDMPRARLYERINERVDAMMAAGLLQEVRALYEQDADRSHPALQSIGYRELFEHLDGAMQLDEAVALVKRNSRRYAKRQLTWFRRYDDAVWLDARQTIDELTSFVLSQIREDG